MRTTQTQTCTRKPGTCANPVPPKPKHITNQRLKSQQPNTFILLSQHEENQFSIMLVFLQEGDNFPNKCNPILGWDSFMLIGSWGLKLIQSLILEHIQISLKPKVNLIHSNTEWWLHAMDYRQWPVGMCASHTRKKVFSTPASNINIFLPKKQL